MFRSGIGCKFTDNLVGFVIHFLHVFVVPFVVVKRNVDRVQTFNHAMNAEFGNASNVKDPSYEIDEKKALSSIICHVSDSKFSRKMIHTLLA